MKNKKQSVLDDRELFWSVAKDYISHQLPVIQKASHHTVNAYRDGLNLFIDYLESNVNVRREDLTFKDFSRENIKSFLDWMINVKNYADKTINLRLTAIHSLLEYAGNEYTVDLMSVYVSASAVKCIKTKDKPIEYFSKLQMKSLLSAPNINTRTGRRNQMMLILYYDTGARNSELLKASLNQVHLDAEVPYITILGKGRKYRNIPLMNKTVNHLRRYFKEFHSDSDSDTPLFYAVTYGKKHRLSTDTVESMIKNYCKECRDDNIDMPEKPICHMIRKTRAMDLYKSGMPLTHIQQLLGHKDISTTSGFYAFATLDTISDALKKANNDSSELTGKWNDANILKKIYKL